MRKLRVSLVGAVTMALLGGASGPAIAQDPEAATWTPVTGRLVEGEWTVDTTPARWEDSVEFWPAHSQTFTVEWSDPRLPETMHLQRNPVLHHGDMTSYDDFMFLFADSVRLEDPLGAWAGSARGVIGSDGTLTLWELTGEGEYNGLSALLEHAFDMEAMAWDFDGFIFESDLPLVPALEDAPAE